MSDTPNVLIVDDDETSREYLAALARRARLRARRRLPSGREALERLVAAAARPTS